MLDYRKISESINMLHRMRGLLFAFDFDWTLVKSKGEHADVDAATHTMIQAIKPDLVIVTGRDIEPAYGIDDFLKDKAIRVIGGQGSQMRSAPHKSVTYRCPPIDRIILDELNAEVQAHKGLRMWLKPDDENPLGIWLDYRKAHDPGLAESAVNRLLNQLFSPHLKNCQHIMAAGPGCVEIFNSSVSKLASFKEFLVETNSTNKRIIAAGDTMSDYPVMEQAQAQGGLAFCVGDKLPRANLYFEEPKDFVQFIGQSVGVFEPVEFGSRPGRDAAEVLFFR